VAYDTNTLMYQLTRLSNNERVETVKTWSCDLGL